MINLKDLTFEELKEFMINLGEKPFRAKQIFSWLHRGIETFDEMTDISLNLRQKLAEVSYISRMKIIRKLESKLDKTKKYLFELGDGNRVESVVMYYKHGITICISCQVGCRMGCKFCASTIGGLVRSLTPGEILDQVLFAQKDIGERISNIVMMGIGEPLDNFDNVIKFLINVNDERGINIGYRHISLSTCGVVPNILRLKEYNFPLTLSVSLHAPTDDIRSRIMPVNKAYNIDKLLDACRDYAYYTKRRISFEYALIKDVNDNKYEAVLLAKRLKGMLCHVNLIPVNNVDENNFEKPTKEKIKEFMNVLEKYGIPVTVRRELGSDISASCGQLRRKEGLKEVNQ
ncbi:MAG: 23S rRNA (adenine(2503)-C(2))-methyltransferase RlmN [Clostridia bacterium]|nr:23S rRNA (adenine(2503)-C(2))-methyltransferase RlmN [Clostridia bacterium]